MLKHFPIITPKVHHMIVHNAAAVLHHCIGRRGANQILLASRTIEVIRLLVRLSDEACLQDRHRLWMSKPRSERYLKAFHRSLTECTKEVRPCLSAPNTPCLTGCRLARGVQLRSQAAIYGGCVKNLLPEVRSSPTFQYRL